MLVPSFNSILPKDQFTYQVIVSYALYSRCARYAQAWIVFADVLYGWDAQERVKENWSGKIGQDLQFLEKCCVCRVFPEA